MAHMPLARAVATTTLGACCVLPAVANAEFFKDSKATIEARNFYFNRDLRDTTPAQQSKREEWAQGFIVKAESGFTEGTVGFGLDAYAALGLKLDSSADRTGTGLLPGSFGNEAPDDYSEATATAKVRVSKTVAQLGRLTPRLPTILTNDSRLLPQMFLGGQVNSQEISGLNIDGGVIKEQNQRDSSNFEDLSINGGGKRNFDLGGSKADNFNFAGASYKWTDNLTTGYNYGELEEIYKQHIVNLVHVLPIADKQSLKTDLRYARSTDDGNTNVDNNAFGAMLTYSLGYSSFGLAYQSMSGDTGFAYLNTTDPFLVNYVQIGDFANKDEKSWQARYDYNFAGLGIPGLTFMTRYISGDNIDQLSSTTNKDGKEWERNTDIAYTFQTGPLKDLGIRWRNATVRNNFANDLDENRLIVSYTLALQ